MSNPLAPMMIMMGMSVGRNRSYGCRPVPDPYQRDEEALVKSAIPSVPVDNGLPEQIDWLGAGSYWLDADHCWRSDRVYRGLSRTTRYFEDKWRLTVPFRDGEQVIASALAAMNLPVVNRYTRLSLDQCQVIARLADQWRIPWCYQRYTINRFFMRDLHPYCLIVSFTTDRNSIYRANP